jgi:hypothetical protein
LSQNVLDFSGIAFPSRVRYYQLEMCQCIDYPSLQNFQLVIKSSCTKNKYL